MKPKRKKKKPLSQRERQRIATTRENQGEDFFSLNAQQAGLMSPTKFTSESGAAAANARWKRWREAHPSREVKRAKIRAKKLAELKSKEGKND